MARLYRRDDLRLAALATLSGILTATLALVFWFAGLEPGPALTRPVETAGEDPFVGAFQRGVSERLSSRPVPTEPLRGPLSFRAQRVVWEVPGSGETWARATAVTGTVDMAAANRGDISLGSVRIADPTITLRTNGRTWNYERPLAGLLEPEGAAGTGGAGRRLRFEVSALAVDGGTVNVDMPEQDFRLTDVGARLADLRLAGPGLAAPALRVVSAEATLRREGAEPMALASERGALTFPSGTTTFDLEVVTVAGTRLEDLEGVWDPTQPGYGVTATGLAPGVQLADIRFLAPDRIPETGSASFRFRIEPLAGDGTAVALTELVASSEGSRVSGSLAAEVFPQSMAVSSVDLRLEPLAVGLLEPFTGPLPYSGTLTGTLAGPGSDIRLDIVADLRADGVEQPFQARLVGGVALGRDGLDLRELTAELRDVPLAALRPYVPGLALTGRVNGTVTLDGLPGEEPLAVNVRLEMGTGLATVEGTIDLTGAEPRYDVAGRLVGIELQSVLANAPPVGMTARFTLAGAGAKPAEANARLTLNGGFSGWESQPGDSISVVATVNDGVANVERLYGRLATAELSASGQWQFVAPVSGAVEYRLAVESLEPFGPYVPVIGDSTAAGSLRAEGTVSGPLDQLRLAGTLAGEGLRVGEYRAGQVESEYSVAFTGATPEVEMELTGSDIATPTAGSYTTLTANVRMVTPELDIDVRGARVGGGEVSIVAEGTIPREGARTVYLQRAFFDLQEGRWELESPARISWGDPVGSGIRVADFRLRNARTEGVVEVDGLVFPLDRLDARVVVADLPLDQVADLLGRDQRLTGRLSAEFSVRPPAASPEIEGTFTLVGGSIEGVGFSRFEGSIDYRNGTARTELLAAFDSAAGSFELNGTLPVRISFADSLQFGLTEGGPLDATLRAERVALRPLNMLITRVRDLEGVVDGTVTLAGTVEAPQLGGELALSGGAVRVPDLNQAFDSIAGVVAFSGRRAEIRDLRVRRDGWARVNGTATFEELDRPVFDLRADLDGFQPIGVDRHADAAVSGSVAVTGELDGLVLTGDVTVDDGYVAVPQFGRAFEDDFLESVDPTPVLGRGADERGGGTWLTNMRISNLEVTFGEGAWFEAAEATAQLAGTVTVNKSGDEVRVLGTLEGERGTYTLVAGPIVRRFEVVRSQVRFFNEPEPNPAIDIVARRVVLDASGRRVEVDVQITGTLETPRLALASADAPNIPESELLAFLLFGRPSFALGEDVTSTGEDVLQQTFVGGFAELASLELERALSSDLGLQLDLFQVRFGQGFSGLTTPTFVLGRQLSDEFFLTVESGINALFAEEGSTASNWAIRLEWAIDRRSSLQLGLEPVNRARLLRGIGAALPLGQRVRQQLYVEYRRRWVY